MLTAEIIAIGSELLTPGFRDTNSLFLTEQLEQIGIPVVVRTIVGDRDEHLEDALRNADDGNFDLARKRIQEGKDYMNEQMNRLAPSTGMSRQMETLSKYEEDLHDAELKTEEEKKEMQKSGKYDNYNSRKNNQ